MAEGRFKLTRVSERDDNGQPRRDSWYYAIWDRERDDYVTVERQPEEGKVLLALVRFLNAYCPAGETPATFLRGLLDNENWTVSTKEL